MRTGIPWMVIGGSMFILGLILFYSISPEDNKNLENIKNTGTFVGLTGIGVAVAGILLFLINRNQQPINENYDTQ
jgi:predicted membrane channel-forming protein YqfA (hemolysin III family)